MDTKQLIWGIGLIMLMAGLLASPCYADEIIFKDQKRVQTGTVLDEDEDTVTVRFSRESIQSVVRGQEGVLSTEKSLSREPVRLPVHAPAGADPRLQERIERLEERLKQLESNLAKDKSRKSEGRKTDGSPTPVNSGIPRVASPVSKNLTSTAGTSHEQLLQEEMGRVEGAIMWKGKPLANRSVKIVLEKYTGFSWTSVKRMFSRDREGSSDQISLMTETDSQGRYVFEKVPPGHYRLYWMPDTENGWYHRMRERPDFEVIASKQTVQNIPGKKR